MKTMAGWATSSTAIVRRLRCSALRPLVPSMPTMLSLITSSSTSAMICSHRCTIARSVRSFNAQLDSTALLGRPPSYRVLGCLTLVVSERALPHSPHAVEQQASS